MNGQVHLAECTPSDYLPNSVELWQSCWEFRVFLLVAVDILLNLPFHSPQRVLIPSSMRRKSNTSILSSLSVQHHLIDFKIT